MASGAGDISICPKLGSLRSEKRSTDFRVAECVGPSAKSQFEANFGAETNPKQSQFSRDGGSVEAVVALEEEAIDPLDIRPLPDSPRCKGILLDWEESKYSGCAYGYGDWLHSPGRAIVQCARAQALSRFEQRAAASVIRLSRMPRLSRPAPFRRIRGCTGRDLRDTLCGRSSFIPS